MALRALYAVILYRLNIYEVLNRASFRIVRMTADSGLAQEFRILIAVLPPKAKIKNRSSSVYLRLSYVRAFIRAIIK